MTGIRLILTGLCLVALVAAHPMGNFSVSHYSRFEVGGDGVRLVYALDLAEIPTFELLREWRLDRISPQASLDRSAAQQAREWASNLRIAREGRMLSPRLRSTQVAWADGAGGLPVLRITSEFDLAVGPGRLDFEDRNYEGRAGWKEIVVAAARGASLNRASHTSQDRSRGLTAYPEDPAMAPPQDLRAAFEWTTRSAAPAVALISLTPSTAAPAMLPAPTAVLAPAAATEPGTVARGDFLSVLLGRGEITFPMLAAGIAVAFGLGAMHALSPGHGKTLVAAYLVGSRGTLRHAAFLGAMVTFTHTVSVFSLGLVTLFLSRYVVTETLYPVLGAISGLSIVALGGSLLRRRIRAMRHAHGHDHHHDHAHGDHHHPDGDVTLGSLVTLGASGGLTPCPSALVLLLSSIALGKTGVGLLLLVAFSLGLSSVLIAIGALVVSARRLLPSSVGFARNPAFRLIPVASACVILCLGLVMTGVSLGWIKAAAIL